MSPSSPLRTGRFRTMPVCEKEKTLGQSKRSCCMKQRSLSSIQQNYPVTVRARNRLWGETIYIKAITTQQTRSSQDPTCCTEIRKQRRPSCNGLMPPAKARPILMSRHEHLLGECKSAIAPRAPRDSLLSKAQDQRGRSGRAGQPAQVRPPRPASNPRPRVSGVTSSASPQA